MPIQVLVAIAPPNLLYQVRAYHIFFEFSPKDFALYPMGWDGMVRLISLHTHLPNSHNKARQAQGLGNDTYPFPLNLAQIITYLSQ